MKCNQYHNNRCSSGPQTSNCQWKCHERSYYPQHNNSYRDDYTDEFEIDAPFDDEFSGRDFRRSNCRPCPSPIPWPGPWPTPCPRPWPPCPKPVHHKKDYLAVLNTTGGTLTGKADPQRIIFDKTLFSNGNAIAVDNTKPGFLLKELGIYEIAYNITYTVPEQEGTVSATINTFFSLDTAPVIMSYNTAQINDGRTRTVNGYALIKVTTATINSPALLTFNIITNRTINHSDASVSIQKVD